MDWDMAVIEDDDDIVFKVKRSAIAEALRSNALVPIPATDANIDVAVNQLFSKIKEVSLPVIDDYYFDLGMDYFYNGRSLYTRIYELFEYNVNFNGLCLCLGFSWVSKDESILYLAITNATKGLTVLHLSFAALDQVVNHEEDNFFGLTVPFGISMLMMPMPKATAYLSLHKFRPQPRTSFQSIPCAPRME